MATCPHCKFEFFQYQGEKLPSIQLKEGDTWCHDCVSGYIRPYKSDACRDCWEEHRKDGLSIAPSMISTTTAISKENYKRKMRYFREMDMRSKQLVEEDESPEEA